jgi:hypothetical protein
MKNRKAKCYKSSKSFIVCEHVVNGDELEYEIIETDDNTPPDKLFLVLCPACIQNKQVIVGEDFFFCEKCLPQAIKKRVLKEIREEGMEIIL